MKKLFPILFAVALCGQVRIPGPGGSEPSGGGTPFAIIAHTSQAQTGAFNAPIITPAINSTGANICWVAVSDFSTAIPTVTVTDSNSNIYAPVTMTGAAGASQVGIWFVKTPTVGAGHTATVTGSAFAAVAFMCASGSIATGTWNQEIDAAPPAATTAQAGSVTPSNTNQIVLSAISVASDIPTPTISSINSGFTLVENVAPVVNVSYALGFGYLIQTAPTAANPTWTLSGTPAFSPQVINATFKSH